MKTKFQRMNYKERKQAIKDFKNSSPNNLYLYKAIVRLKIIGVFGILYSIFLFVLNFIQHSKAVDYIIAGCVIVASVVFVITSYEFLYRSVNKFVIKKK